MPFWDSIRWRIFVYYTALITTMITLLAVLHVASVRDAVEEVEKSRLRARAIELLPIFFPPPGPGADLAGLERSLPAGDNRDLRRALQSADQERWFFLVLTHDGRVLFRTDGAPEELAARERSDNIGQMEEVPGKDFLTVALMSPRDERLLVGISRRVLEARFTAHLITTAAVGVAALLAASVAGFLIISRGLRPIVQIGDTAQRLAEGDLAERIPIHSQRSELDQLATVLNRTFDRLAEALARQVRFTADASHELRTPVAAIVADCQFSLKKERSAERYRETIEVCHESAQHMKGLIERLSLLAKFDAHDAPLARESVGLQEVAQSALAVVGPVAGENGIAIEARLDPAPVEADRLRIGQVAINLLGNAVRYNRPGGKIILRTGRVNGLAFLEVEDNGIGIPADKLDRVFDRFFRVDDSRNSSTGGSGLGLAICKSIVEAHAGRLSATSEFGRGSCFRLEIPAAD
jgi:two-component system OmpR family sensor kinase